MKEATIWCLVVFHLGPNLRYFSLPNCDMHQPCQCQIKVTVREWHKLIWPASYKGQQVAPQVLCVPAPSLYPTAPLTFHCMPPGSSFSGGTLVWTGARASLLHLLPHLTTQCRETPHPACSLKSLATRGGRERQPKLLPSA